MMDIVNKSGKFSEKGRGCTVSISSLEKKLERLIRKRNQEGTRDNLASLSQFLGVVD